VAEVPKRGAFGAPSLLVGRTRDEGRSNRSTRAGSRGACSRRREGFTMKPCSQTPRQNAPLAGHRIYNVRKPTQAQPQTKPRQRRQHPPPAHEKSVKIKASMAKLMQACTVGACHSRVWIFSFLRRINLGRHHDLLHAVKQEQRRCRFEPRRIQRTRRTGASGCAAASNASPCPSW
jgi:hypothetical protein